MGDSQAATLCYSSSTVVADSLQYVGDSRSQNLTRDFREIGELPKLGVSDSH